MKGVDCTACASNKASASNSCELRVRVILIIKILLQPRAKTVSCKGAQCFVERRLAPTKNEGYRPVPLTGHFSSCFGTFMPIYRPGELARSWATPTVIKCCLQANFEYTRVHLRVLTSLCVHNTRKFAHASGLLTIRESRTRSSTTRASDFACHASHSHSFVNLRLSATVKDRFLQEVRTTISMEEMPVELILNWDQTAV